MSLGRKSMGKSLIWFWLMWLVDDGDDDDDYCGRGNDYSR